MPVSRSPLSTARDASGWRRRCPARKVGARRGGPRPSRCSAGACSSTPSAGTSTGTGAGSQQGRGRACRNAARPVQARERHPGQQVAQAAGAWCAFSALACSRYFRGDTVGRANRSDHLSGKGSLALPPPIPRLECAAAPAVGRVTRRDRPSFQSSSSRRKPTEARSSPAIFSTACLRGPATSTLRSCRRTPPRQSAAHSCLTVRPAAGARESRPARDGSSGRRRRRGAGKCLLSGPARSYCARFRL